MNCSSLFVLLLVPSCSQTLPNCPSVQVVRTMECNLGNMVADVMRHSLDFILGRPLDCAVVNGGTLRSDMVHNNRMLTKRDLLSILPMMDEIAVVEILGKDLLRALEVGVSSYPKLEGRFLHVRSSLLLRAFVLKISPAVRNHHGATFCLLFLPPLPPKDVFHVVCRLILKGRVLLACCCTLVSTSVCQLLTGPCTAGVEYIL